MVDLKELRIEKRMMQQEVISHLALEQKKMLFGMQLQVYRKQQIGQRFPVCLQRHQMLQLLSLHVQVKEKYILMTH